MRLAHLKDAERPLAVVDGDRVAPLSLDGIATVDELIAAGPDAWESARGRGRESGRASRSAPACSALR